MATNGYTESVNETLRILNLQIQNRDKQIEDMQTAADKRITEMGTLRHSRKRALDDAARIKMKLDDCEKARVNEKARADTLAYNMAIVLKYEPDCERCEGHGGEPQYDDDGRRSLDNMDPPDVMLVGFADPEEDPCEECSGTGREMPSEGRLRAYAIAGRR